MTTWIDEDKIMAHQFVVHNEQVFHLKNTYTYLWDWLKDEGFLGLTQDEEPIEERIETYYEEKRPQPGMREIRVWWRTAMVPEGNTFYRYRLNFFYEVLHIKKVDIMFHGRKATADDGEIILRVDAILELDYQRKWRGHAILKHLFPYFSKRIFKKIREDHEEELRRRAVRLQEDIKRLLELQNYEKYPERFHVERGL